MTHPPIVFLDTETLGLDPAAPIWEFAAIRRHFHDDGEVGESAVSMFIQHDPADWLDDPEYPDSFKDDYRARFDPARAIPEQHAADIIATFVGDGAVVHASNPMFDMEHLQALLSRNRITPGWHYHPIDVPTLVQGYLKALGRLPEPPLKSDKLAAALGVDPADYPRHTAMGDVEWIRDQYDALRPPRPIRSGLPSLDAAHLERQRAFSLNAFGPGNRTAGVLDHLAKELEEVRAAPLDLTEWADLLILAFDGAWRTGAEPQAIIDAVIAKQTKNESRTWPDWRTADPDKAIEHVRSGE